MSYSSIISSSAFRRACLGHRGPDWAPVINLMWLSVPLCLVLCLLTGFVWLHLLPSPSSPLVGQYQTAVLLVLASSMIHSLMLPAWVVGQIYMFYKLRVVSDFVLVLLRQLVLAAAVVYYPDYVVVLYGAGMLATTVIQVAIYYGFFAFWINYRKAGDDTEFPFKSVREFLPDFGKEISEEHKGVTVSFMYQGVVKQFLTEGDRYVMTLLSLLTLSMQGVYESVSGSFGSFTFKCLFLPIDECAYTFYCQLWTRNQCIQHQKNIDQVGGH